MTFARFVWVWWRSRWAAMLWSGVCSCLLFTARESASAQVAPPTAIRPLPGAAAPGPQPASPPNKAPHTPLVPQPEATSFAAGQAPSEPAPFPEGPSPPPSGSYPQQPPVYAPPYAPTQPGFARAPQGAAGSSAFYGQYGSPSGNPQPLSYQRPLSRPPGPGSHEHEGFFLRVTAGGGAAGMSYRERFDGVHTSSVKTRGLAGSFDVAIGARVVGNLIVHGNAGIVGIDARRSIDGVRDDSYRSIGTKFWLFGAGVTYYVMPSNLYLSLVLGTGGMLEERDYGATSRDQRIHSSAGFASALSIGKEWWVGGRGDWGIGASITGAAYAAPIDVAGVKSTAVGNSISLAFSATLN